MPVSKTLIAAGAGVYLVGSAAAYSLFKTPSPQPQVQQHATFDSLADDYDAKVNFEETFMGLKLLRRWLVAQAQGDVLEISAGTGRNIPYYKWRSLQSVTMTDASRHMLFYAKQKHKASQTDVPMHFRVADAAHICSHGCAQDDSRKTHPGTGAGDSAAMSSRGAAANVPAATSRQPDGPGGQADSSDWQPQPPDKFDFVIDTFGLCSHAAPVEVLKEASRVCKPGGRILLLEHGRAKYGWLNSILDRDAAKHKARWACNWNLDIEGIVRDAGLRIISQSRWHFGTTYVIIAEPAAVPDRRQ